MKVSKPQKNCNLRKVRVLLHAFTCHPIKLSFLESEQLKGYDARNRKCESIACMKIECKHTKALQ